MSESSIGNLSGQAPFSALTASIEFGGATVGLMQNINWNENNNLRRVNQIGSSVSVVIASGIQEYEISAQKAFLEADLLFDIATNAKFTSDIGKTTAQHTIARKDLYDAFVAGAGNITIADKVIQLLFNVAVKDASNKELFKFVDCSIQTRRVSMDQSGIIVMADLTLMSRLKQLPTFAGTEEFQNLA
jgi:hypothetical protein